MNHETSIENRAAEGHLIGDLSTAERSEFEEHFFQCGECAEDARLGAVFAANLRAVFDQQTVAEKPAKVVGMPVSGRWTLALAAGVALCLFTGWQNAALIPGMRSQIRALETPRLLAPITLAPSARAGSARTVNASGAPLIAVTLAPGGARGEGPWECRLVSEAGAVIWRATVREFGPDGGLTVLLPASALKGGRYEWVVSESAGRQGPEPSTERYAFELIR